MEPLIRPAAPADLDTVAEIFTHYVRNTVITFEEIPPPVAAWRQRLDDLAIQELPFLVAELSGEVVGYAYATPWRPKPAYRHTVENSIYIAPSAQGQGVGGLLLGALITACTERGFRQMVAVIGDGTGASLGSRRLHEKAGFRLIGIAEKVGFKHGRWLDQMLMQKELGEGGRTPPAF